ncbi:hypothetical protein SAMN05192533_101513 [Mesobacillus persicus]|uniref:CAAX prenyl protease 2/Lysostaphin resistance protein A-like domain-containing protein n=1 Tax=Mesobacillus persicus TaxID=930146 RepID=A0A1H7WMN3_9BACI|nr:CPBP family intramembrane glutamic endopeptidase [Mesobacillus persicus]SEM22882.1 hypothetical protein SAMN05192533_101513 [Mesobacillus persicus]
MEYWYWLILAFILIYEPIYGYFDYQKFKKKVRSNPNERVKYYKKVMVGLWIPTLLILCLIVIGPLSFKDIGLKGVEVDTQTLGTWMTYVSFGIGIVYTLSLIYYLIGAKVSVKMKNEIAKIQKKELEKSKFADIMPVTIEDNKMWTFVSWTAGITEEVIYRGFLIFALSHLFPTLSVWVIIILSSILFGLAHTYQGFSNVVRTTIFGLFFAVLYIGLDSILPLIVFHFLVDYIGKIGNGEEDEN